MTSDLACNTSGRKDLLSLCQKPATWSLEEGELMEWRVGQPDYGFGIRNLTVAIGHLVQTGDLTKSRTILGSLGVSFLLTFMLFSE